MDKEREIEELTYALRDAHYSVVGIAGELPMFIYEYFAKMLQAFPRKQYRECIANDLYQRFSYTPRDGYGFTSDTVKKIFSKFGVEVDE